MADERKSFLVYGDIEEALEEMTNEEAGILFKTMVGYFLTGEESELSRALKFAWIPIKKQMDRDQERYDRICEKNRENIRKRWNKKDTTVYDRIPTDTKNTNKDTDTDTDTDKEKDTDTEAAETATNVSLSVVQYLNQQAGTRHRVTEDVVDQVEDLITAGYSEADIRTVIDKKSAEWKNDDRMRPNLRPSVLFGAKFPEYYGALDTGQAAADREEAERKKRARKAREEQAAREAALEAEHEAGRSRLSPEEVQARLAAISKKTFN